MDSIGQVFNTVLSDIKDFVKQPFSSDMGLLRWGLFTGLVIVLSILWTFVLKDVKNKLD